MKQPRVEVVCEGGPREMGVAQGAGLRERIHAARRQLAEMEAFRLVQPWWMPYRVFRRLAEWRAGRFLRDALARHAPDMARRLAGIAEGAAIAPDALYLFNGLEALMASVGDITAVPPGCGCSAVAVRGTRSATGEPILAHNFDYIPLVQPFYIIRRSRPEGRLASLDFTAAPLCGTVDGVNERGLCIAYNFAFTTDGGKPAPPISMAIAEALGQCATVGQAAEWIASRPRPSGGILMLADAEGDVASLELTATRQHLRRPAEGEDVLFHTNALWSDTTCQAQIAREAVFTRAAPAGLRGVRVLQSPEARDRRLAELLPQTHRLGPGELAALMSDHGPAGQPDDDTLCMHGSYWQTTACLQLFPRQRKLRVAYASACEAQYEEIGL